LAAIPNTHARPDPRFGSKPPNPVAARTNVSEVRSATVCGSPQRRAKYAVTALALERVQPLELGQRRVVRGAWYAELRVSRIAEQSLSRPLLCIDVS
jgi:hypothetical protein